MIPSDEDLAVLGSPEMHMVSALEVLESQAVASNDSEADDDEEDED